MEHEVVGKMRARVAAWRHGNPARGLKLIAVAGAYGKTTTVMLLGEILQETGRSVMTLTDRGCFHNGVGIGGSYDNSADSVQHCLSVARKKNVDYVIIEVSNAFVATHVLPTLTIEMSVVTNDSPSAQALLNQPVEYTVVPAGFDVAGLSVAPHQAISFGEDEASEAQIANVTERRRGTEIDLVIDHQTKLSVATYLVGKANALNVAAAVSAAYVLATDTSAFDEGVARLERVAGNYDYLPASDRVYDIVVDATVSDVSVALVLESAAKLKKRRLLVAGDASLPSSVFPLMKRLADKLVIVGSNPELPGVDQSDNVQAAYELITRGAKKDDVVLLIGKQYAELGSDQRTKAHQLAEEAGE